jgi:hypothetical protein
MTTSTYEVLQQGAFIPAMPLALMATRQFDQRRQRALICYYVASGVDGLAVGVHTTQFEIREPRFGLFKPVLELAADALNRADVNREVPLIRIAGVCGATRQAVAEAACARDLGYHAGLLSLAALHGASEDEMLLHCRAVSEVLPVVGFHLQAAVGGVSLPYYFWRKFADLENVVAIKIAPFNRYQTLDVVRAVADSGRSDIALYTGNDDHIVLDLLTPFEFTAASGDSVRRQIVGGLLGHWAVWTHTAVKLFRRCRELVTSNSPVPAELLSIANAVTDCNSAFFDAANNYRGCIPGIHEVLRRQGLLDGTWCLDENLDLSAGQSEEIERVCQEHFELCDDDFVAANLDFWLSK